MRGRLVAGALGLGCAGLMLLGPAAPAQADGATGGRRMAAQVAADCEQADGVPGAGGPAIKLTADVPDGSKVAPGQDIAIRVTWNPQDWQGRDLDSALACVRVKGGLDPGMSAEERPTANDGVFEYRVHVPENIRPGCDICVESFLAGVTADDCCPRQVASDRRCFMSGPPVPPASPPATNPPAPPAPPPPVVTEPVRVPTVAPAQVAGTTLARPATPALLFEAELPRTGPVATRLGTAGGGFMLSLGGLAVMGGSGRRRRR